jgi:hypothetical protein
MRVSRSLRVLLAVVERPDVMGFVDSPANPAPAQLVMPDFSKSPGGFGNGATATNKTVYLAVVEEWAQCLVSVKMMNSG